VSDPLFAALLGAAGTVGSLHSVAPDHWAPFVAIARAQHWSRGRTARTTILCGFGHVTASVVLGLVALYLGLEALQAFGRRMESVAGLLLIGFGIAYAIWGLRRSVAGRLHGHSHAHYDHVHDAQRRTSLTLFLLFSADPCVAVMPLMFAAAPLGTLKTLAVVLAYEASTIGTMVLLVLPAHAGAQRLRSPRLDRFSDVIAGAAIVVVGLVVAGLGL
jgi:nickel/cobalt exporter